MGRLHEAASGKSRPLEHEHVVGRSPNCALVLDHAFVSSQHAVIRWSGESWEIRDLGSRNGTRVDGRPVVGPDARTLVTGSLITFGHDEVAWELIDDAPPEVLLIPIDGEEAIVVRDEVLALPSTLDPSLTIFCAANGAWQLEREDAPVTSLYHGALFEADGRMWRFCCPSAVARTSSPSDSPPDVVGLHFFVSRDEEHVELKADVAGSRIELGASARNYLLLTLARQRFEDRAQGLAETSCGWLYQQDLLQSLRISQQQLNVDVFRIRHQLAQKGLAAAAGVIERRPRTHQIRLGVEHFEFHPL